MFVIPNPRRFAGEGSAVRNKPSQEVDSSPRLLTPFESRTDEECHNFEFFGKLFSCALTDAELRNR
jgi:hypothetical protein